MEENPRQPRRRWFQYRLRTLLIVMTVAAVPLGWWSYNADRQRRAAETLERHGAIVSYGGDSSRFYSNKKSELPVLLHWRYRVRSVSLDREPTDNDIAALQALDGLEEVSISDIMRDGKRLQAALPRCQVESNPQPVP